MSAQYTANVRGIEIDVTKTMNRFLNKNEKTYSKKQFEDYLKKLNLIDKYENTGENEPINDGFVVTFDFEEDDDQDAFAILATGMWTLHYTSGSFSKEELKRQQNFLDEKYLDKNIENKLVDLWKDKLVLKGEMKIESNQCENVFAFFPKDNNANKANKANKVEQSGGAHNDTYYKKYIKYKNKYVKFMNGN